MRTLAPNEIQAQVWNKIETLDLDPIKCKLMDPDEGIGWSRGLTDIVESQYRQFLKLTALGVGVIVPTKLIDQFWHAHILDTRKYAEDCDQVFGYFLHHFPYLGMRGEQDRRNLEISFRSTQKLAVDIFGAAGNWSDSVTGVHARESGICTSCGTSDCAPDPSCSTGMDVPTHAAVLRRDVRPTLERLSA